MFASNSKVAFHDLTPDADERDAPWAPNCRYAAGNIFGCILDKEGTTPSVKTVLFLIVISGALLSRAGAGDRVNEDVGSLHIRRTRAPSAAHEAWQRSKAEEADMWGETVDGAWAVRLCDRCIKSFSAGPEEWDTEVFVAKRCLRGLVPDALLEAYQVTIIGHGCRPYSAKGLDLAYG